MEKEFNYSELQIKNGNEIIPNSDNNSTIFHDYDNYEYYAVDFILNQLKNYPINEVSMLQFSQNENLSACIENPNYLMSNGATVTVDNENSKEQAEPSFILYDEPKV